MNLAKKPDLSIEKKLWSQGFDLIAGVDEVGRGPIAGPVVAAAVILKKNYIQLIMDNKYYDFPFYKWEKEKANDLLKKLHNKNSNLQIIIDEIIVKQI